MFTSQMLLLPKKLLLAFMKGGKTRAALALVFFLLALLCFPQWGEPLRSWTAVSRGEGLPGYGRCIKICGRHGEQGCPAQIEGQGLTGSLETLPAAQVPDLLRFHVRAHSNSPRDQKIKNDVAQKVLARYRARWTRCQSSDELGMIIMQDSAALASYAREILQSYGCFYDVKVSLVRDIFPARCYEGKLYPPGEYTALFLIIGEGRGENWWCVLFPPLCFSIAPPTLATAEGEQKDFLQAQETASCLLLKEAGEKKNTSWLAVDSVGKKGAAVGFPGGVEKGVLIYPAKALPAGESKQVKGEKKKIVVESGEILPECRFWLWEVLTRKRR